MEEYDYEVLYMKNKANTNSDALFRMEVHTKKLQIYEKTTNDEKNKRTQAEEIVDNTDTTGKNYFSHPN